MDDFINSDLALGGTGANYQKKKKKKYIDSWGGAFVGWCSSSNFGNGELKNQDTEANYWSQSECNIFSAYNLYFDKSGDVSPQDAYTGKFCGFTLRCVRNP
jgi:hypothetical protein